MRRVVLVCLAVGLGLPASADAAPTGRLLVSLRATPDAPAATAIAARAVAARAGGVPAGRAGPQVGMVTVRPRTGQSPQALAARLRRDPDVRAVDLETRATPRLIPDDPVFSLPDPAAAGQTLGWWALRSNFPAAWDRADGDSVTVAIIDQGVEIAHPDLAGKIRAAVDFDSDPSHGGAATDEAGHGTHVASLACAQPGNGIGLAGAGFDCGLIVEKSDLTNSSVVSAIVDATDRGASVISMSFGTDDRARAPQAMKDAVDYAYDHGVVLVAAAADKHTTEQGFPANILQPTGTGPDLAAGKGLSVTAADFTDRRASFAGDGSQISMAAYGAFSRPGPDGLLGAFTAGPNEIERGATTKPCACRTDLAGDTRYAFLAGTSMAAPIVAGAAALVRDANPDLGPADVIRVLKRSAHRPSGAGWTDDLGWGIVDAGAAVQAALRLDRRPPASSVLAPSVTRGRSVVLRVTAADSAAPGVRVAGVRTVRVYRARNGHDPKLVTTTADRRVRVRVRAGARYTFYTQAIDRAGNLEPAPDQPDARTRVALQL
jgi:subtilisin family serine protease